MAQKTYNLRHFIVCVCVPMVDHNCLFNPGRLELGIDKIISKII